MAKEIRFIHKQRQLEIILLVSIATVISLMSYELTNADDSQSSKIIGSWQVYKDDDRPEGPIPKETMSFWANGKFLIAGDHPHEGLYRINGNQMELQIKIGDQAITAVRQFELSSEELKFKNEKIGWVYYKRISEQPAGEEPYLNGQ